MEKQIQRSDAMSQHVGDEKGAEGKEGWKVGVRSRWAEPKLKTFRG